MENNTTNNIGSGSSNNKGLMVFLIIIILVIIGALVFLYMKKQNNIPQPTPSEKALGDAIMLDSTTSINSNLDSIDLEDPSSEDMKSVDAELQNL